MRVLLDTNVLLDVLLQRGQWLAEATAIWQAVDAGRLEGFVSASAMTDLYYIARKLAGEPAARNVVRACLEHLTVVAVDAGLLRQADALPIPDFEDALQVACAAAHALDAIVTRDAGGFPGATVAVLSPTELATHLATPPQGSSES
jgi:predicted nucleic acid-binding protein